MNEKKKIIIIEDQPLLNCMLKQTLEKYYNVIGSSTNAKDMEILIEKQIPDLILTDVITSNNENGIYYAGKIKEQYQDKIKIIAITGIPEISFLNAAKKNKLDGLIYKDIDTETLLTSINQILNGYTLFPDNYIINKENKNFEKLSNKELIILKLLCEGLERETIADKLNITTGTLKNYISNILNKMEFESVSKLTIYCISNGFIVPEKN